MAQNGGTHAQRVENALERYEQSLIRYARRITGDLEQARDVVQDTFLRLCRVDTALLDGHVGAWLYKVCRNRALDVRKKEGRMTTASQADRVPLEAAESPVGDALEQREDVAAVQAVVATLPDEQQEAFRLKFEHGLTYREIGTVMNIAPSKVSYVMAAALTTLREQLRGRLNLDNREGSTS